jgi:hypothetical protein
MRKYLFSTGLVSSLMSGMTLLRSLRSNESFTWRQALAWLSWGITLALAIGAIVDTRRAGRGHVLPEDSPRDGEEQKLLKKRLRS